jgi:flagellar biosynthesis/type III secretory pathway protein FliH
VLPLVGLVFAALPAASALADTTVGQISSPAATAGCQDPTGAYHQGFNAGFNSGFNSGFHAGFNSGFHTGLQPGFHAGFGASSRHGAVSAASGASAIRAHAIPAECNPQFNQGFHTAFNVGFHSFNSGFQQGFNSGFTSGFKSGFRHHHHG